MTIAEEAPTATAQATRTAYRTCPLCEASCGLEITLRPTDEGGEEVVRIRGDRDDVFSRGYLCPKGSTLKQLHDDPDRLRRVAYVATGLLTAASVAACGMIGFVGLIVPHAIRRLWGPLHRALLPAAFLAGGAVLVLADALARSIAPPLELPVGVVTALIGVPVFVTLLRRTTR